MSASGAKTWIILSPTGLVSMIVAVYCAGWKVGLARFPLTLMVRVFTSVSPGVPPSIT